MMMTRAAAGIKDRTIRAEKFVWTDLFPPDLRKLERIMEIYPFHRLDIEDCLSKSQLPKIDEYGEYLFIVLHFPRFLKDRRFSIPSQVSCFLGRDFLVTVHNGELKPLAKVYEQLRTDGAEEAFMDWSSARLLYRLLSALIQNLTLMMGRVFSNLEKIEDKVFDERTEAVRDVTELRHDIANLRRIVLPLKTVIQEMERRIGRFSGEEMTVYFGDLSDQIQKTWTILEECKETIEIYKDTDFIISSDRTNKILSLLTILFTFSIPSTILGTFYGMNVTLPGGNGTGWTFLGPYTTFYMILAASFTTVATMYFIFRRLRWL
ncbi:MAG: magnesium transporter CorA family protein [Nitrospirales bacterium]|nr:magnesium transporter CorA family protein [Nitrospirales bacterium]